MTDIRSMRAAVASRSQDGEKVVVSERPVSEISTKLFTRVPSSENLMMSTILQGDSAVVNSAASNVGSEVDEMDLANPNSAGNNLKSFVSDVPSEFGEKRTTVSSAVNLYQQKKTVAQGMMDLALLSANANQLRYVIDTGGNHPYYYSNVILIAFSIILQVCVGVGLILNSQCNVSYEASMLKAIRINNYTVLAIFFITALNVIISSFGISNVTPVANFTPSTP